MKSYDQFSSTDEYYLEITRIQQHIYTISPLHTSTFHSESAFVKSNLFIMSNNVSLGSQLTQSAVYTTAFMLASRHSGLEIKILYYCTLYNTVLYNEVHKNTITCGGCTHPRHSRHVN